MARPPSTFFVLPDTSYYASLIITYHPRTAGDQNATDDGDMITFLHYVFFAPLFQCGPLIRGGFDTFSKRLKKISSTRRFNAASKQNTIKRVARQIREGRVGSFRLVSGFEFLGYKSNDIICTTVVVFTSSLETFTHLRHLPNCIQFRQSYRSRHALHRRPPTTPPLFLYDCLASFRTLWWNFHVSFRDFFARNIYSKRESKTVAIALTFLVSACFHDVSFSDRRWIYFFLANTFGVLLERSRLLSSSVAAPKKEADERRRGVVVSSRLKSRNEQVLPLDSGRLLRRYHSALRFKLRAILRQDVCAFMRPFRRSHIFSLGVTFYSVLLRKNFFFI